MDEKNTVYMAFYKFDISSVDGIIDPASYSLFFFFSPPSKKPLLKYRDLMLGIDL